MMKKKIILLTAMTTCFLMILPACGSEAGNETTAEEKIEIEKIKEEASTQEPDVVSEEAKTHLGTWDVTFSNVPGGREDTKVTMTFEEDENGLKGVVASDEGETKITDLKIDEEKISGKFYNSQVGVNLKFKAKFDGDKIAGKVSVVEAPDFIFDISGTQY